MIQIQDWEQSQKIIVVDENHHGTVQVEVPKPGPYKDEYYQYADCAIYNLWVDEQFRKQGSARLLMEAAEQEAKKLGCKSVQLEWKKRILITGEFSDSFRNFYSMSGSGTTGCGCMRVW